MLVNGLYSNIRGFLFFLVIGCQNNVKAELSKIYGKFFRNENSLFVEHNENNNKNQQLI